MDNTELKHHGILGMKWGVRRYQNKDGSLTAAGKKRADKIRLQNLEKARKAKADRKKALDSGRLPAKKMTEKELKAKIDRLDLEKKYLDAKSNVKLQTSGQRFVQKFKEKMVDKLAEDVAADLIAQTAKALGAKGINKILDKYGVSADVGGVFTNNKKKS